MKVINLFGGPGTGKSTVAAGLFTRMKIEGYNVELVTEYAKDMTWEERSNILSDQMYILAKQNRRISRLEGKVDYIITDSPLILGYVYVSDSYFPSYQQLLFEVFNSYNNYNYLLQRPSNYSEIGRNQTREEAEVVDSSIKNMLDDNNIVFSQLPQKIDEIFEYFMEEIND